MFEEQLSLLSEEDFRRLYCEYGAPQTILQLLPAECQQIFNILFCFVEPLAQSRIISNFQNLKVNEIMILINRMLVYHICESVPDVTDGSIKLIINPVFRQTYTNSIDHGQLCKWKSETSKKYKENNNESVRYCEECYERNISLLLDPMKMIHVNHFESVKDLFIKCKLMQHDPSNRSDNNSPYVITPLGYQFLLKNFHDQAYLLLNFILQDQLSPVPFFSFLFNLRHVIPRMPYRVDELSDKQKALLPLFNIVGLVLEISRFIIYRFLHSIDDIDFFYVTRLGSDFLSPSISYVICKQADSNFNLTTRIKSTLKIVVESNFRIYAFGLLNENNLHIQILSQFVEIRTKLPDMVAFIITRDSVVRAIRNGISADQICSFLEEYSQNDVLMKEADSRLERSSLGSHMNGRVEDTNIRNTRGQFYKIPMNITDQIYLWEKDLARAKYQKAYLYKDLDADVLSRITDMKDITPLIVYKDIAHRLIVVNQRGKELIDRCIRI